MIRDDIRRRLDRLHRNRHWLALRQTAVSYGTAARYLYRGLDITSRGVEGMLRALDREEARRRRAAREEAGGRSGHPDPKVLRGGRPAQAKGAANGG